MALSASQRDPRFPPVRSSELDKVSIEISVLSPMKRIVDPINEVEPGKHGIYIKRGFRSGTYLPQVATDHNMSREEFLTSCTAHKAGLPPTPGKIRRPRSTSIPPTSSVRTIKPVSGERLAVSSKIENTAYLVSLTLNPYPLSLLYANRCPYLNRRGGGEKRSNGRKPPAVKPSRYFPAIPGVGK